MRIYTRMSKKPRRYTLPEIRILVDRLDNGSSFRVADYKQRQKVLDAARFQDKHITTRENEDGTFTVLAI